MIASSLGGGNDVLPVCSLSRFRSEELSPTLWYGIVQVTRLSVHIAKGSADLFEAPALHPHRFARMCSEYAM